MSNRKENLIVGLDIGTTKICAIIASMTDSGLDIVGIGTSVSRGLRKGVVINIESTVEAIKKALQEAELMAGCEINSVFAGIAGAHITGFNSQGVIAIKNREVTSEDVQRVIDAAKAIAIPMDREVIHVIPQEFIIDDQDGIKEPLGMSGVRLESKVHIVTGAVASAQNIVKSCNKASVNVADIVLEPLASSEAVLSADEKELGVAIVDIGGGTTDLAIFVDGAIKHTAVLSLGGNHLTNDIAVGLRTPMAEAERIKHAYGSCLTSDIGKDETIEVPSVGGREPRILSRQLLAEILEPRVEEIFTLVNREIVRSGFEDLIASGVVITGGTSILPGMPELAEQIFNLPVRRGVPQGIGGLIDVVNSPIYATGVGLVIYGSKNQEINNFSIGQEKVFDKVMRRMKEWFGEFF
ncbi:cell division protein FtsA [Desulfuromonas acetoxidans]|uniref:Cell division protein FtsA n=1 Tax=Desulfuromonas acetoxidans (strain DSM 684 / 11070) TaxID=281689 RepID=Q1JXC0_DESA6|nr:cell division protein FtsA [Desulfuromonas acetoxidans]EAT14872.1 cell division protein FtsA [Desulfuromonas acetoxidans DSM 684]MBF0646840.1 cell division protein FtsA [Desulfuromonas acetoxidans]NVD23332.1 cell division protein FtsA [Desulfuromonas acetoxidans]NVE15427.1 cell division protein FtsA [Desulfuromonas acetoxidans]